MSLERRIDSKGEQEKSGEREFVFWKYLSLITMQEAERLGISPESPVFASSYTKNKQSCDCGVDFSPIIYYKGLIKAQHYHGHLKGGIYHYVSTKQYFDKTIPFVGHAFNWLAILGPVSFSIDPSLEKASRSSEVSTSSKEVNLLQIRAFSENQELKEGFLVTDMSGVNLFPSSTKDHPFITEYGFRIIEDGSVLFFNHSSLAPKSF